MGTYPDELVPIQCHIGDGYAFWWTGQRQSFYGVTGTPTTWFDGLLSCVGAYQNDQQMINWYNSQIVNRLGVPTDVTIDVYGVETGTQTYEITVVVGIEASGTAKDMIVHVVQLLDKYPASADRRYRNCARDYLGGTTVDLAPGESALITHSLELDGIDWDNRLDVKIVAFAQEPGASGPKEIYNAGVMGWPFVAMTVEGDVDLDGDVDLSDLSALLATYGLCAGDPGYVDAADFVDDDCIDLADLSALLANYGYGT